MDGELKFTVDDLLDLIKATPEPTVGVKWFVREHVIETTADGALLDGNPATREDIERVLGIAKHELSPEQIWDDRPAVGHFSKD
jgi:hypothetical protein